jgi:putative oxidoreductase
MKINYTPVLLFFIKLMLGTAFIYSAYYKIADPAGFARTLYGYAILPGFTINLLAISIPFVELVAGFSLLLGLYPRSALLIITAALSGSVLMMGFNLFREHPFDPGCCFFSGGNQVASNVCLLVKDLLMLVSGFYLLRNTTAS